MPKNYNDIFNNLPPEEQAKIKARYEELRKEYLENNPKTIAERLEKSDRAFFEGDPNSSERATRKRVAAEATEEKHHKRSK